MIGKVISVVSILILILMTSFILRNFYLESQETPDAFYAIPPDAETIIRGNTANWAEFKSISKILLDNESNPALQELNYYLSQLDSIRGTTEIVQEVLQNDFYLSFFENKIPNWLFSIPYSNKQEAQLEDYLKNLTHEKSIEEFNNSDIHCGSVFYVFTGNCIHLSPEKSLIKSVINRTDKNMLDQNLLQAKKADGQGSLNILSQINSSDRKSNIYYNKQLQNVNGWASIEPIYTDGVAQFIGYIYDSTLHVNTPEKRRKLKLNWNIIPRNSFHLNIHRIQNENSIEMNDDFRQYLSQIESECTCSPDIVAFNNSQYYVELEHEENTYFILDYDNFSEALEEFLPLIKSEPLDYKDYPIFELKYPDFYARSLDLSLTQNHKFFAYIYDHLIFSNSLESIEDYIDFQSIGNSMNDNSSFLSLTDYFNIENYTAIANDDKMQNQLLYPFNLSLNNNSESILQINKENGKVYINSLERLNPKQVIADQNIASDHHEKQQIKTEARLRENVYLLKNHYTAEQEILLQDVDNTIHYYSSQGTLLWSKKINGPIQDQPQQIDIYKNDKLQMVFNTESTIYCLDRNGNSVEKFPIELNSSVTSKLAIFDYDKKKNYRLVVACQDGSLRNYTKTGETTKGWEHEKSSTPIKQVEHINIKGKDYIFAVAQSDQVSFLKRNGKVRVKSNMVLSQNISESVLIDKRSSLLDSKIIFLQENGKLISQVINSEKKQVLADNIRGNALFKKLDLNNDKKDDLVILESKKIQMIDASGELIGKKLFIDELDKDLMVFKFNQVDRKIGVKSNKELFLIDAEGNISNGFPKNGKGTFRISDIDKDGVFEMIYLKDSNALLIEDLN